MNDPITTGDNQARCEHDWRIDPRAILPTNPPTQKLVCAVCGFTSYRRGFTPQVVSNNPKDWPNA